MCCSRVSAARIRLLKCAGASRMKGVPISKCGSGLRAAHSGLKVCDSFTDGGRTVFECGSRPSAAHIRRKSLQ
eukprot:2505744-Pyramimonas_sp.AAC.1